MLDIKYIKGKPGGSHRAACQEGQDARAEIEEILKLDGERRALIAGNEAMKAEANKTNKLDSAVQAGREGRSGAVCRDEGAVRQDQGERREGQGR